jgi:hypothetical protein
VFRTPPETILGHTLPEPRLTAAGLLTIAAWASVPVLVIGSALDLLAQWAFGVCTGLWCAF